MESIFYFQTLSKKGIHILLSTIISEHHELYLELFTDSDLKPKHHFMVHYPRMVCAYDPIIHL
ncbi:hypothetical protein Anas_09724 [Armadillidium nasatum]|uniref:Uncharacterized protein n=1 Tax=Armadillidium nasatum TaxID=96803 RepID=A0A5N5SYW8_9CRUS|nr:hypothetical protein Anas_09724 [Armadillidium nasatum]